MLVVQKRSRLPLLIAVIFGSLLISATYGWRMWHGWAVGGATQANSSTLQAPGLQITRPAVVAAPVAPSSPDGRPAFINPEDWVAIQKGLRDHPRREAELRRIVAYLGFHSNLQQWKAMEEQSDAVERARVGEALLEALPERLLNQEVTGGEALLLQATLIKYLAHDQASFNARMQTEKERLNQALSLDKEMQAKLAKEEAQAAHYKQLANKVLERSQANQISEIQMQHELQLAREMAFK